MNEGDPRYDRYFAFEWMGVPPDEAAKKNPRHPWQDARASSYAGGSGSGVGVRNEVRDARYADQSSGV